MWSPTKIVLDGKSLLKTKKDTANFRSLGIFESHYLVIISQDSLVIKNRRQRIGAKYKIQRGQNGNHLIYLASDEKELNGAFQLTIDTVVTSSTFYEVYLDIVANSTQIALKKGVHVAPWKPRPPQRGRP